MKSNLERAHLFAHEVAAALNAQKLAKPDGGPAAVMIVCMDENDEEMPVGASLNCSDEGVWDVAMDAMHAQREGSA